MIIAWVFRFLNFPIMGDFIIFSWISDKIEFQNISVQWIYAASVSLY